MESLKRPRRNIAGEKSRQPETPRTSGGNPIAERTRSSRPPGPRHRPAPKPVKSPGRSPKAPAIEVRAVKSTVAPEPERAARSRWTWLLAIPVGTVMTTSVFLFIGWIQPGLGSNEKISLPDVIKFEFKVATADQPPPPPPKREPPREEVRRKPQKQRKATSRTAPRNTASRPRRTAQSLDMNLRPALGAGLAGLGGIQISDPGTGAGIDVELGFSGEEVIEDAREMLQYQQAQREIRALSQQGDRRRLREMVQSGRLTEPRLIFQEKPEYPAEARKKEIEGWVHVRILISLEGSVDEIEILSARPEGVFEESLHAALPAWQFTPAKDGSGKPIEFWKEFKYRFVLDD